VTQSEAPGYSPDFNPPQPKVVRFRKYFVRIVSTVAVVALIVTGGLTISDWWSRCGEGLTVRQGECTGVTDLSDLTDAQNSFRFDHSLKLVEDRIKNENAMAAEHPAVTVAVLMPMTGGETASQSLQQIRAHVEGAALAQMRANRDSRAHPKVRLVLANEGSNEHAWADVVEQLIGMVDDPQPLVAVTGLGVSIPETVDGALRLSEAGIPMVGSVITADELNKVGGQPPPPNRPIPGVAGLSRVGVSNDTEVRAIAEYLAKDPIKPLIVRDTNSNDFYTAGLRGDFEEHFQQQWRAAGSSQEPYDGTSTGVADRFDDITQSLCGPDSPDTVLYSGRASLLTDFITKLRKDQCKKPITVITGSDGSTLQDTLQKPVPGEREVTVVYAALADRNALQDPSFVPEFSRLFGEADLNNGWSIMAHDAMTAVKTAIREASGQSNKLPSRKDVWDQLTNLNSSDKGVQGAGGRFEIDTATGDPVGRKVPVIKLGPHDKQAEVVHVYRQPNPRCPGRAHEC
jgi:ABC-type branched-subunit amino acid transport system substrate-binding protein